MFCVCADSAVGRFVVPLVFCDDDVFSMFRGMPRAALIVTELGPRATLVRMRAVALAFSAPPVRLLFSLSSLSLSSPPYVRSPSPPPSTVSAGSATCAREMQPRRVLRGRARLSLGQVDGWPAAITPRLHTHDRAHARTHHTRYTRAVTFELCGLTHHNDSLFHRSLVVTRPRDVLISNYELGRYVINCDTLSTPF